MTARGYRPGSDDESLESQLEKITEKRYMSPEEKARVLARSKTLMEFFDTTFKQDTPQPAGEVAIVCESTTIAAEHPSLEVRGGVDPNDVNYFSQLGETRGD